MLFFTIVSALPAAVDALLLLLLCWPSADQQVLCLPLATHASFWAVVVVVAAAKGTAKETAMEATMEATMEAATGAATGAATEAAMEAATGAAIMVRHNSTPLGTVKTKGWVVKWYTVSLQHHTGYLVQPHC